jgi:ribosomal protein S18 acetylase RimI-like enzyme
MDISFRLADVVDIDLLVEFMQEFYEAEHLAFDDQVARTALQKILSDDSLGRIWLIQLDSIPIGYVVLTLGFSLEFHGRDAFIDEIYIRAQYQGRGIGRRGLEFIEDGCRSLGVRALHLEVERDNTKAQAVYRKFGFKDHDRYLLTKWIRR